MRFAISLLVLLFALAPDGLKSALPVLANDDWSEAVNGLQARLELVERGKINGTRLFAPHLELRNVRDLAPWKINLSEERIRELRDYLSQVRRLPANYSKRK